MARYFVMTLGLALYATFWTMSAATPVRVFLVPHSHQDVGWTDTIDNVSIQVSASPMFVVFLM